MNPIGPALDPSNDESFRALGLFVYEFSRLIWWMRTMLPLMATKGLNDDIRFGVINQAMKIHTGEMGAQQLVDTYFAVAALIGDYDEDEAKMAAKLRSRLIPLIRLRNDFLHGEWEIGALRSTEDSQAAWTIKTETGEVTRSGGEVVPPTLSRTRPGRMHDTTTQKEYSPQQIAELAAVLQDLRGVIIEWSMILTSPVLLLDEKSGAPELQQVPPRDLSTMTDGEVRREGPLAPRSPFPPRYV
ncbi:MAG: hypothetical protein JO246_08850 [Frankiaceae bacterium]|nr:hypothetical protein [Frankiaceae bacterium]MBV9869361.1 hypothetical protein [Frankiaceae bacterium]